MPRLNELQESWKKKSYSEPQSHYSEETLVVDLRGAMGPAQIVEQKLFKLLARRESMQPRKPK